MSDRQSPRRRARNARGRLKKLIEEARRAPTSGEKGSIDVRGVQRAIVVGAHGPNRACDTKVRFQKMATAQKAARDLMERYSDGIELEPYPCPFCGSFHLHTKRPS